MLRPHRKFNRVDATRTNMTKLTDLLKSALEKKKGQHHLENTDGVDAKKDNKKRTAPPVPAGKPMKKASGRGR